jgi:YHS domain-containing protein
MNEPQILGRPRARHLAPVLLAVIGVLAGGCGGAPDGFLVNDQGFLDNVDANGVVLDGYDVVAYFTQNHAVQGSEEFQVRHKGSLYYFSSAEHRDTFNGNPTAYTPQFGGFCAMAAALRTLEAGDPGVFALIDGQLFIYKNGEAASLWRGDAEGNMASATANWPKLVTEAKERTAMG